MNKKGSIEAHEIPAWIYRIIFFIFCVAAVYLVTSSIIRTEADTSKESNDSYLLKFLKDDDCLALNSNGIKKTGLIDISRFNSDALTNCLKRKGFSAKLLLKYEDKNLIAFNDEETYDLDNRLCFSSRYRCMSKYIYIAVKDKDKIYNASLNASVVLNVEQ